jgi:hypothetical protein
VKLTKLHRRAPGTAVPVPRPTSATRGGTSLRIIARLAAALAAGSAALLIAPAVAQAAPQDVVYTVQHQVVSKTRIGEYSTDWTTCLHVAKSSAVTHPSCTYNVSVSTHVEASGGVNNATLSSGFGFGVSVAYSYGYGISVDVPAHTAGNIQVGVYYWKWSGTLQQRTCHTPGSICGSWGNVSKVAVEQAISPSVRFAATAS